MTFPVSQVSAANKFSSLRAFAAGFRGSFARSDLDGEENARFVCLETVNNSAEGEIELLLLSLRLLREQVPYL